MGSQVPGLTDKGVVTHQYTEHVDLFPTLAQVTAVLGFDRAAIVRFHIRVLV